MNNQYGFWNPKGTSNSEYGKFNFYEKLTTLKQTPGTHDFNNGWNQQGQQQQPHYPGCQHYQGQSNSQHQHNPGCPNAAAGQSWGQSTGWNQNQGDGQGETPNFTVQVGDAAATAALGGQLPKNTWPSQSQAYNQQQAQWSQAASPTEMPLHNDSSNIQPQPEAQTDSPDPSVSGGPGESGDCANVAAGDAAKQPDVTKAEEIQKPKQVAWKGIPRTVKYGRHIQPSYAHPYQTLMQKMGQNPMPGKSKPSGQMPMPRAGSSTSVVAPNKVVNTTSSVNPQRENLNKLKSKPPAHLCGKCNKCKTLIPASEGPSIMSFPLNSAAQNRKSNVRSMHNLGQQDAKNFRAIRFN